MKRMMLYFLAAFALAGTQLTACKSKKATTDTTTTTTVPDTTTQTAPVTIASDDALTTGVRDATKDYPGVTANVSNGEVTLTGTVKRDRLTGLIQSIQSLHPKKVNNNLTVQP